MFTCGTEWCVYYGTSRVVGLPVVGVFTCGTGRVARLPVVQVEWCIYLWYR